MELQSGIRRKSAGLFQRQFDEVFRFVLSGFRPLNPPFWQGRLVVIRGKLKVLNRRFASKLSLTSKSGLQLFYDDHKLALPILGDFEPEILAQSPPILGDLGGFPNS